MPIYEYQCQNCGHHLEVMQRISDSPLTQCPKCNKGDLQKIISATQFQLKGSGWYVTDYKKENTSKKTEGATAEKSSTESKAETSSDKSDSK